jgi:proteasome lid subunit RPN8/RPN11
MSNQETNSTSGSKTIPTIKLPIIQLMTYGDKSFVKMNVTSYIVAPNKKVVLYKGGFLFEINYDRSLSLPLKFKKEREGSYNITLTSKKKDNTHPEISLVENFPIIFHPHFTQPSSWSSKLGIQKAIWIDYLDREARENEDLMSYLERIAYSLRYNESYINLDARKIANRAAMNWYQRIFNSHQHSEYFPTDQIKSPNSKPPTFLPQASTTKTSAPLIDRDLSRKPLFVIEQSKPPYSPAIIKKSDLDLKIDRSLDSEELRRQSSHNDEYEFYLQRDAFRDIENHIGWGHRTNENGVEQGGILLGHAYRNPNTNFVLGVAEQAISGRSAKGSSSYLEVTHETWKKMLDDADRLYPELQVIGWYHTHPNNLDVFMSGVDYATQKRLFHNDWQFAIVLNPHKKIWRAFYGSESSECRGYVLSNNTPFYSENHR